MKEQAKKLGFGVGLITSAHVGYSLMETGTLSSSDSTIRKFKGCKICLISLECGRQIMGPNIKIRSDLSSCEHIPAVKVNVKPPDSLAHLIETLPSVEEMPTYNQQVDASMDMLRNVSEKLTKIATTANIETLEDIAKRIATGMRTLEPSLPRHFDNLDTLKQWIIISLISFLLSMMLHILFFWVYNKYSRVRRLVPQFLKGEDQKTNTPMKPVM